MKIYEFAIAKLLKLPDIWFSRNEYGCIYELEIFKQIFLSVHKTELARILTHMCTCTCTLNIYKYPFIPCAGSVADDSFH